MFFPQNVNTCPVDRQPFTLILVRRSLEGKVIRQISVDTSRSENNVEDPPSDPTFCEVTVSYTHLDVYKRQILSVLV